MDPDYQIRSPYQLIGKPDVDGEVLFFGYYDKSPWNPSMSKMVFHSLTSHDTIDIKVFDLEKKDVVTVASSQTWNYQQGAMVQWLDNDRLIYNDMVGTDISGSKILELASNKFQEFEIPIQCINPNNETAIGLNYSRLMWLRPDYGYHQSFSNFKKDMAYNQDGLWMIDLKSGKFYLMISIAELMENNTTEEMSKCEHKVNHVMYSPDGEKIIFMHRWLGSVGKWSRLYVYDIDSRTYEILLDDKMVSHYSWRNNHEVITWARYGEKDGYYLIDVATKKVNHIQNGAYDKFGDGHPTINQVDHQQIITDTYPDKGRVRHLLLCELEGEAQIELGQFFSSWKYEDEKRCNLHPRWSSDGQMISIDSAHDGLRKSYVIIRKVVKFSSQINS
ncbi:MAG: hypothetical protein OCD76_15335 [Reichenbachiella sp.]